MPYGTVLYCTTSVKLSETYLILQGEELHGSFACKPNERNNRDLDFDIHIDFQGELGEMNEDVKYKMH
jgi:hypothetical protein